KAKVAALLVLALMLGAATAAAQLLSAKRPPRSAVAAGPPPAARQHQRLDQLGDPLPARVVARVGTLRWFHGLTVYGTSSLTFSPDGKVLLSCDTHKAVQFLDADTGREVRRIVPSDEQVSCFAVSPDGTAMATAYFRSEVLRIWDVRAGRELRQLRAEKP